MDRNSPKLSPIRFGLLRFPASALIQYIDHNEDVIKIQSTFNTSENRGYSVGLYLMCVLPMNAFRDCISGVCPVCVLN